jgi:hypothetical protein
MKIINVKGLILSIVSIMLLSGCAKYYVKVVANHEKAVTKANTPFFLAYDAEEVILDQSKLATITSTYEMELNRVRVAPRNMRSANSGFFKSTAVVDVLPGKHEIRLTILIGQNMFIADAISCELEAGRVYHVITEPKIAVVENTNADVAKKIIQNRNNAVFEAKKAQ